MRGAACVAGALLLLSGCAELRANTEESQISGNLSDAAKDAQMAFDYEVAVRHYQTLYQRDGDNLEALLGYARNLRYAGSPRDAIKVAKKGLAKHGEPRLGRRRRESIEILVKRTPRREGRAIQCLAGECLPVHRDLPATARFPNDGIYQAPDEVHERPALRKESRERETGTRERANTCRIHSKPR